MRNNSIVNPSGPRFTFHISFFFLPLWKALQKWFAFARLLRARSSSELWMLTPSEKSCHFPKPRLLDYVLTSFLVSWQLFTSVFGVGPKTAEKWYRRGLRSFSDVLAEPSIQLNRMQQTGKRQHLRIFTLQNYRLQKYNSSLLPRMTNR